jgi:hypothetical protein
MEKKLRAKLEEEVRELREEGGGADTATAAQDQDRDGLLRKLSQLEEKVSEKSSAGWDRDLMFWS